MRKVLPTFYYLDHFAEFLQFLTQYNAHLLRPQDIEFITVFRDQPKDVQCVLVRSLNLRVRRAATGKPLYHSSRLCVRDGREASSLLPGALPTLFPVITQRARRIVSAHFHENVFFLEFILVSVYFTRAATISCKSHNLVGHKE